MERNTKGIIGWSIIALIFGIIGLIPMIAREIYQYFKYLKPCDLSFEWDDIARYTIFIGAFSLFHWCICDICDLPIWTMF